MLKKIAIVAAVAGGLGATSANAACTHNGTYYAVGSVICSGGWLQECTAANYWGAIGQCRSSSNAKTLAKSPTKEMIFAAALGDKAQTPPRSAPTQRK